jgi:NADH:ubiquinone oxidoreductase subunit K
MNKAYLSAIIIEVIGIIVVSGGIVFEYLSGETIGFIVITVGSVIVAIGSLFYAKVYRRGSHP